ncbi:hypothetical protein GQ53DRAFT_885057 [Thozetella sp. PMI_491]|nr:hypothetical protein GQ53DRAFT_885057 [Thozetella sp. PMI_491]
MSLSVEVDKIQKELTELRTRLDAFEAKSKVTIQSDHTEMLNQLRSSVAAVEGTALYLETGTSRLAGYLEYSTPSSDKKASKAIAQRHLTDMDGKFTSLRSAASVGMENLQTIKKSCDDIHEELGVIRTKLASLTQRTEAALGEAKKTLQNKRLEAQQAKTSLENSKAELRALEAKMESEKEARNGLRVARAASLGLSILFPPMLLVSGGLEVMAASFREDRRNIQNQIDSTTTQQSSLSSEIATLESQATSLQTAMNSAQSLRARTGTIKSTSEGMKVLIRDRLVEYQSLKDSTNDFEAWTSDLNNHTAVMKTIGPSTPMLQRTTKKIIDTLLAQEQSDIKSICGSLRRLEITSK